MGKLHRQMEFVEERNADVMRCFRKAVTSAANVNLNAITEEVARMQAGRFWVSVERACAVISCVARGLPVVNDMRPCKQRLYLEIFRRYLKAKEEAPDRTLTDIISEIIEQPAPEFYMEPLTILDIVYKTRRKKR